jgi:hypothetical protein
MGCWFSTSRSPTTASKEVEIVNNSQLSLHLWANGGGPVCKCPPGKTTTASLPAHLSSHGPLMWTATLGLPGARSAGMQGLHVCSWNQMRMTHDGLEPADPPRTSLRLNVDLAVHDSVNSRLSNGHDCERPPYEPRTH